MTERDDLDAPGAAVVNEALAREIGGRALDGVFEPATPRFLYGNSVPEEFIVVGVAKTSGFADSRPRHSRPSI